jgi:hypothetical protein
MIANTDPKGLSAKQYLEFAGNPCSESVFDYEEDL